MSRRLLEALKARYKTPGAALRALGVDENLLGGSDGDLLRENADKFVSLLLHRYGSQRAVLQKLAMDASMLTEPPRT